MVRNTIADTGKKAGQEVLKASQTIIEGSGKHLDHISTLDLSANSFEKVRHRHDEAQLLLVIRGLVTFDVHNTNRWLVPPQNAIWIPAGIEHSMVGIGEVELHCVYLDPGQTDITLSNCCTVGVSPLLRELIIKMSNLPGHIDVNGPHARLITAMLDQLAIAPQGDMQLALPTNPYLRKIAEHFIAAPSDRTTIPGWAKKVGMSERTLQRVLLKETGMSFGRWRRQFHILLALQRFAEGDSVHAVAYHLGYDSSSAFIEMFRKVFGKPPLKFLTEHGIYTTAELDD